MWASIQKEKTKQNIFFEADGKQIEMKQFIECFKAIQYYELTY